jgi:hypothetical protein
MTAPKDLADQIRRRADFACEYCGVTESDTGGELTVDHFQPRAHGGTDDLANLLYCCHRCNLYKADNWPSHAGEPVLWNPRTDPMAAHLLRLVDGTVYPITAAGAFTLRRLRLNRPPLVAYCVRRYMQNEELQLLTRYRDVVALLEQLQRQYAALLEEHRNLLEEHRALLALLLRSEE